MPYSFYHRNNGRSIFFNLCIYVLKLLNIVLIILYLFLQTLKVLMFIFCLSERNFAQSSAALEYFKSRLPLTKRVISYFT